MILLSGERIFWISHIFRRFRVKLFPRACSCPMIFLIQCTVLPSSPTQLGLMKPVLSLEQQYLYSFKSCLQMFVFFFSAETKKMIAYIKLGFFSTCTISFMPIFAFCECCGLSWQAAKHYTAVHLLPLSGMRERTWKKKKVNLINLSLSQVIGQKKGK